VTVQRFSNTAVDKAGAVLREFYEGGGIWLGLTGDEVAKVEGAHEVAEWYRAGFTDPLLKSRMGVQSFINTLGLQARIAQRHKRLNRIIQKLVRFPTMRLTAMQDIGGCRVIVPGLDDVETLFRHIEGRWRESIKEVNHYIANPQSSGYRAIHVVVRRDNRPIEIQLRTERQHRWADLVEDIGRVTGEELKWGGASPLIEGLEVIAYVWAHLDRGERPSGELRPRFMAIAGEVVRLLKVGGADG
jgi:hypothetical protein